jgi:ABC-type multidrug transport system fused ATPase/permease subunit
MSKSLRTRQVVLAELRRQLPSILTVTTTMLMGAGVSLLQPAFYKHLFDTAIPSGDEDLIIWLLIAMIVTPVAGIGLAYGHDYLRVRIGEHVSQTLRWELFCHAILLRIPELESITRAGVVFRIKVVAGRVGEMYIAQELLPVISHGITLFGAIVVMVLIDGQLAAIACVALPITWFVTWRMSGLSKDRDAEYLAHRARGEEQLTETLEGLRTVKAYGGESKERLRWRQWIELDIHHKLRSIALHQIVLTFPNDVVNNLVIGIILGIGALRILDDSLTIGSLIAFMGYTPRAYGALRGVLRTCAGTRRVHASADQLDELFERQIEPDTAGKGESDTHAPEIEFRNVSFSYGRGFELGDVSFTISPGEFLAVVGPSGGGKSTIYDLLLRFHEPLSGSILVDGADYLRLPLADWRKTISWMPQDVFLWDDSIADNLTYPERPDLESLDTVLTRTGLDGMVNRLPEGLQTRSGHRGELFSGGERQRISLGRAILSDRPILLIDEATSALDAISEQRIRSAIEEIRRNRTTIVIAHRFSTIQRADRILVLDETGRMSEIGTPAELLSQDGLFRQLLEAQKLDLMTDL